MPLVALSLRNSPGGVIVAAQTAIAWTAANASNTFTMPITGRELLLVRNTGASPASVTIKGVADSLGRAADAIHSLAAGEVKVFGPFPRVGWAQADGLLYLTMATAGLEAGGILLP